MNVLSLFAGIGGLDLGLERAGMTVVGQVEIDPFCQRVLAKHWPEVPRHDDVRSTAIWWLDGTLRPAVDIVAGGFPCQDISNAGRQAGIHGERSGLWAAMRDTVRDLRPAFVFLENVSALLVRGLDVVAGDLAEIGYDARWDCVPASAVGAPHRRDRFWCLAHLADPDRQRRDQRTGSHAVRAGQPEPADDRHPVAGGGRAGLDPWGRLGRPWPTPVRDRWWTPEPGMGGTDDGLPRGLDRGRIEPWERGTPRLATDVPNQAKRLRALGNAVVPQVAEHVGRVLLATAGAA